MFLGREGMTIPIRGSGRERFDFFEEDWERRDKAAAAWC